jgi:hypothetical protein
MTPIAYFTDIWQRCAEIETLHTYLAGKLTRAMSADALLRAEWVARVSALDLYVHELVAQNMVKIFEGSRNSCPGFSKFHCSNDTLLRIKNAVTPVDAGAAFDLEVRSKLSRLTYQFPEDIADGIRLVSAKELWNEIALAQGANAATKGANAKSLKKGDAILRYIREVRPSGFGRAIFFTMCAPIRPLSRRALGKIVSDRLAALGIVAGKRGTHALRHAAAQHLLDQGMSMKVIGDFLGHRDPSSTAIYAKVNLAALREVANLDREGLA